MKKVMLVLALAGLILGQSKPKWHNPDAWRKKLRRGLPAKKLLTILGRPAYVHITFNGNNSMISVWYYECAPNYGPTPDNKTGKELSFSSTGVVTCLNVTKQMSRLARPQYRIYKWVEPNWKSIDSTKSKVARQPKKRRYLRKPKKWEMPRAWKKLMTGMPIRVVEKFIGSAEREFAGSGSTGNEFGDKRWYYGDVQGCGTLHFNDNRLQKWSEPFWPEIDKTLYAAVEDKP